MEAADSKITIRRPRQEDEASDADTDDLLTSADILCSGASINTDQQARLTENSEHSPANEITPIKNSAVSATSNIITSARRALNFDVSNFSERNNDGPPKFSSASDPPSAFENSSAPDRSHSCPGTPKTGKSCLKKIASPATSVHFSTSNSLDLQNSDRQKVIFPTENSLFFEDEFINEKRLENVRSLFISAKNDLANACRLALRATTSSGVTTSENSPAAFAIEESTFLEKLSVNDLKELYEMECYKRRHCEKKIDILQRQILDSEQKLSVTTAAVDRQKNAVADAERMCAEFLSDLVAKDENRTRLCENLSRSNQEIKTALEKLISHAQNLSEKLDASSERILISEREFKIKNDSIGFLENELEKIKREFESSKNENLALKKKTEQCENERKTWFAREEQLTKELLSSERTQKDHAEALQKLKNDLAAERSNRRGQAEDLERLYRQRLAEMGKEYESRAEKLRNEFEQRKANEIRKLKDEWDALLHGLSEKYNRMANERDDALLRLKTYEDTFNERQRTMCYELQQRLSAKYYELLSEFSPASAAAGPSNNGNADPPPPPNAFSHNGNSALNFAPSHGHHENADPNAWLTSSMADEFLDRLRNVHLVNTPRHYAAADGGEHAAAKRDHKQTGTNTAVNYRTSAPTDGTTKK